MSTETHDVLQRQHIVRQVLDRPVLRRGCGLVVTVGIALLLVGSVLTIATVAAFPDGGPWTVFVPQLAISVGNGIFLPNCVAGAVSVRPPNPTSAMYSPSGRATWTSMWLRGVVTSAGTFQRTRAARRRTRNPIASRACANSRFCSKQ